jgi:hypothetical protein
LENPVRKELERLPRETLLDLIEMYSRNWVTVDGLWFGGVEEKYGPEPALELDVRMWRIGSKIEIKRIKELLNLGPGLEDMMRAINFLSWAFCFGYDYTLEEDRAVWTCNVCPPQEARVKAGLGEFPCKPTFEACFGNLVQILDPRVRVGCEFCPPDDHPDEAWCRWVFEL